MASAQPASVIPFSASRPEVDLPAWARDFVPTLRAGQPESDKQAKIPAEILAQLEAAGIYKMMLPKAYGGLQTDITTWMKTVMELGRGDAGVAWAVTLVTACNWLISGLYPKHIADKVLADPNVRAAGVFSGRACQAHRVEGGIHVDKGMWFFNSGVYQAKWDLLGVPMFDKDGNPTGPGIALVPMSDVNILGDWDTSGMRASGSSTVSMENVFIPDDHIVSLLDCNAGRQPKTFPNEDLYHSSFAPLMVIILTFPVLGLGMHMVETFLETMPRRDIRLTFYTKQGEAPVTHLQLGEASAKIDTAKYIVERACREIDEWAARRENMPLQDRARICRDAAFADQLVWQAVDQLSTAVGGGWARNGNVLNRIWQDTKVGSQHPFVSLTSNYEQYGRILSGVEPLLMPV